MLFAQRMYNSPCIIDNLQYVFYGPWHIETVFTAIVFYYIGYIFMKKQNLFSKMMQDSKYFRTLQRNKDWDEF